MMMMMSKRKSTQIELRNGKDFSVAAEKRL